MLEMLVLYRAPEDPEAFEKRYVEDHLPMVRSYKNIKDATFHKIARAVMGEPPYAYIFRGLWADKDAWKQDMGSPEAQAATEDANSFAKGLFDVVVLEQLA